MAWYTVAWACVTLDGPYSRAGREAVTPFCQLVKRGGREGAARARRPDNMSADSRDGADLM